MSEPSSSVVEPSIHKPGLGLLVTDPVAVSVVHGGDVVMLGEEEELRGEIEREICRLTLDQAEIEEEVRKLRNLAEKRSDFEGLVEEEKADLGDVVVESDLGKEVDDHVVEGVSESVDVVVSVERHFGSDLGIDGDEKEKKNGDVVESVEMGFESLVGKADDLGVESEEKNVDVVESVERGLESQVGKADDLGGVESDVGKGDLGDEEKKDVDVVERVEGAFESEIGKSDLGGKEKETVDVAESVEAACESEIGKSELGGEEKEETVNGAESVVEGGFESAMVVEGGWGFPDDSFNEGKKNAESVVEEDNENGVGDEEESVGDQTGDGEVKVARYNQSSSNRRSNYPMRPDAEDCTYYMKFGTCKFGLSCKFNHPPKRKGMKERVKQSVENTERMGQTECKYHMTSGGCKYGRNCKYYHGTENSSISPEPELNFLGLPIRLGEKECPYYMRTGSCKYGSNCRFHHPEPTTVGGGDPGPGYGNGGILPSKHVPASTVPSWSSPRAFSESSPYAPVMFPQNHSAPTPNPEWNPSPNPEWNGYQAPAYQTSERGLPTPPAFAMKNLPPEIKFPLPPLSMIVDEYPERPGEPECSFFMKTGDCKYKSGCKFNHPKNRASKAKARASPSPSMLSDKGLPLRPDQPVCSHFHQYGICKYGPACRYDHPSSVGGLLPPPLFSQPPPFDGADRSRKGNKNGIAA